jgi:iron(III) transport system substrate-binding protein
MYQRIRQESQGGAPVADLFEGSQPWPSIVQKDGFFVSMKDKPLPAFKEPTSTWYVPPPVAQENLEYVASRFPANRGHVVVNTNILKPEDYPKNYHDIATNPKFKGKVVWVNPRSTGDVAFKWIQWGYTAKGLSLEDVWRIYSQQSPIMLPAPMDGGGAIARGEGAISFSTSAIESLFKSGAPMKILLFPDVPYVDAIAGLGVVKDAPHPNAALVFVNWVLSKPGQEAITKIGGIRSIRKDVPDGTPSGLAPEVIGGGKRPPTYLMTGPEAMLAGDLHTAQVFMGLPEGVSQADFEKGVNDYVKEWEAKNGGPQDKAVLLEQ